MLLVLCLGVVVVGRWRPGGDAPDHPGDACRVFEQRLDWYGAAQHAQYEFRDRRTGSTLPISTALALAFAESGLDPKARPSRRWTRAFPFFARPSSALGLGQFVEGTWRLFEREIGSFADRSDPADAIRGIFWHAKHLSEIVGVDLRKSPAGLAHAHYHGPGGYAQGLRNRGHAANVNRMAQVYDSQLKRCRKKLERATKPLLGRFFGAGRGAH